MTKMRRIQLNGVSLDDLEGLTVNELVGWAEGIRDQVPPEHRACSMMRLDNWGDGYRDLKGYYERPETEDDIRADREHREAERAKREAEHHARELAEYRRLKAKYEPRK